MTTPLLDKTLNLIDSENQNDPKQCTEQGKVMGVETLYAKRMLLTLQAFVTSPSEPLILACYAQHVCRWKIARSEYPTGLSGYLKWRTDLAKLHASILASAMQSAGYQKTDIERAKHIIQKKNLTNDSESQTLEDVSCLVFLSYYLDDFAKKHSSEKIVDIIKKTWGKMSEKAHQSALKIKLPEHLEILVKQALSH